MYVIELRRSGTGVEVELRGEFDAFSLADLRGALAEVSRLRSPTLVDLSGVSFLDLQSARELAVCSLLYARMSFANPSAEALASIRAFGLEGWIPLRPDTGYDERQVSKASGFRHQASGRRG
ncbi:MAG: STAS domain-containing protein [Rubrobacter sp.]